MRILVITGMLDGGNDLQGASALGAVFQGGNAGKVRQEHKGDASLFVLDLTVHLGAWHQQLADGRPLLGFSVETEALSPPAS